MANIGAELQSIPLEHCIGGPLVAAIKAQGLAARQTVDFIKEVGLKPLPQSNASIALPTSNDETLDGASMESRYVEFKFDRILEQQAIKDEDGKKVTVTQMQLVPSRLTIPLLSIVPVPYIRINDMTIDFEFKIKDVETQQSTNTAQLSTEAKAQYFWFASASLKGSFTSTTHSKRETDKSATLRVTVNAVQDRIPEGLSRVLDMLHDAMRVVPIGQPTVLAERPSTPASPATSK